MPRPARGFRPEVMSLPIDAAATRLGAGASVMVKPPLQQHLAVATFRRTEASGFFGAHGFVKDPFGPVLRPSAHGEGATGCTLHQIEIHAFGVSQFLNHSKFRLAQQSIGVTE